MTDTLSESAKHRLGQQELVLRFFALKNAIGSYKGSISDWLDKYSEAVVKGEAILITVPNGRSSKLYSRPLTRSSAGGFSQTQERSSSRGTRASLF